MLAQRTAARKMAASDKACGVTDLRGRSQRAARMASCALIERRLGSRQCIISTHLCHGGSRRASDPCEIECHHDRETRPVARKLMTGMSSARPASSAADWDVKPGRALAGLGLDEAGIGSIVIATTVKCISDNCQAASRPRVDRRGSSTCHRVIPRWWAVRKLSLPHVPLSNRRAAGSGAVGVR